MKKLNKRGFTMVELLATIVIIGILGTVGVVGVTKSIKSAKDRYYVAQNKLFISAAQTYFTDNKSRLPMHELLSKRVTLDTLINDNYIEKMVDYSKESYNKDSYVRVTKLGLNLYSYEGTLIDSNGDAQDYKDSGDYSASVKFTVDAEDFSEYNDIKYTNSKKIVKMTITDADGIAGYKIIIEKRNKSVYETGYITADKATNTSNQIAISTDKYGDGEYRVKVKVYDIYNDQKSFTSGKIVVDTIAPKCKNSITPSKPDGKNNWYVSETIKTNPECEDLDKNGSDKNASGCDEKKFKVITTGALGDKTSTNKSLSVKIDGKSTLTYKIYDKAGNETTCKKIELQKDSTIPRCENEERITESNTAYPEKGDWTKESITLSATCTDKTTGSGCVTESNSVTFNSTMNETKSITIEDYAGNTNTCSRTEVKIDKTPPSCDTEGGNPSWVKDNVEIRSIWKDSHSGPDTNQYATHIYKDNIDTTTAGAGENGGAARVCDKVGNCTDCPANQTVRIDKTVPVVNIVNANDNKWVNTNYSFTVKTTTIGSSGLASLKRTRNTEADLITINTHDQEYNTETWSNERDTNVCYWAVSVSGVEGEPVCTQVKIDKTAPTVLFTHAKNSTKIYAKCSDDTASGTKNPNNNATYIHVDPTPHPENDCPTTGAGTCHQYTDSSTSPIKETKFECEDKAGNKKQDFLKLKCTGTTKDKNFKCFEVS